MPQRPEDIPKTWIVHSIIRKIQKAKPELQRRYPIKEIAIFGSFARNEQTEESDLDILVAFERPIGWDVIDLKDELEDILNRSVDLVLKGGVATRPRLMSYIEKDAIYA
ncbi:MAG: DNA polymerase beta domain protein region [Methanomicrobiales archaeon 53_19]|jgi:predicted nucleotidyltransferase|uniref:nucleotidyltransferase family protein n=1 Tax=Methanocalculus sp. TaxID=2004547 RepID=UPI000747CC5D|nr:nucleotidyltransferase family protein [Methanocalculus sp.]KUL05098.1 MAG: DNA polymerase beta domain protein region [Methanomicrobiales archaeon 53_19]HIJ07461.1 nucleotidyltransferase family protein [Methanocalculus sp.]